MLALFRGALDHGRALVRAALEDNGGGLVCAGQLAQIEDELIHAIHDYVVTYVHPAEEAASAKSCVIAAVGGYGRATLAPGSDIDLLFLLPDAAPRRRQSVVQSILYSFGISARRSAIRPARSRSASMRRGRHDDAHRASRSALPDRRGRSLRDHAHAVRAARSCIDRRREFVAAKLAERDARVAKAGRSRYLVEPNVKDGKGGLRDLNTLFWIAKYVYEVREAAEIVRAGLFSRAEFRLFCRCEEFLWRVRCHLHFMTGRPKRG